MNAYIFTGGSVNLKALKIDPEQDDLIIAADSGLSIAEALGLRVDILIGDMDSLKHSPKDSQMEIIRLPEEKDVTDTQAAVELALDKGASGIYIIGGIGTRLDHTLSSIGILQKIERLFSAPLGKRRRFFGLTKQAKMARAVDTYITNGYNRIRYIRNNSVIIPKNPHYRYLSILAADETVKGVSVEGCKYPLQNATLHNYHQYAVSNEILGNCAFVSVQKGGVYIIESYDDRFEKQNYNI
jgi:thiamine pyrophosphokinase